MSRNSKSIRKLRQAKQWSQVRKGGGSGPARTQKVNTKRNTWFGKLAGKVAVRPSRKKDKESDNE